MLKQIVLFAMLATAVGGCKKAKWVVGTWVSVEDGKPGPCYKFNKKRRFEVFQDPACTGKADAVMSGKWQLKTDVKLAIQRSGETTARLARITLKEAEKFSSTGEMSGKFFRADKIKPKELLAKLAADGVITVKPLQANLGCNQLARKLSEINALPDEDSPRLLRAKDRGLKFKRDAKAGIADVERVVYAVNQEQLDWIAFHLNAKAFEAPGPTARFEKLLGAPEHNLSTGSGEKRQSIAMWTSYCEDLRGAKNKKVDVTMFSIPGKQMAYYYVSEGVMSETWDELKQTVTDPANQATEEDDGEGGKATKGAATPAKGKAPAKATKAAPQKGKRIVAPGSKDDDI